MHSYHLLEILATGLVFALIFGYLAKRVGLSPIVGYLVAGFIIGPNMPGFVGDMELAGELAEAGVIMMMFGVGLHFNIKDLLAVKGVALPGAIIQSTISAICGVAVAHMFGLSVGDGLILGMGLAVASTVVLLRVLTDNGKLNSVEGHVAVGWLVVEDVLTVLILVLLPSIAGMVEGTITGGYISILKALGTAGIKLVLLWVVVMIIGGKLVPWFLVKIARTRSEELFTLTVIGIAFGTAMASAVFFDVSMALGAFLGGMVVGQSSLHNQASASIIPIKDIFSILFFLSVGMLFSPQFMVENYMLVIACLAIVLIIKPLAATFAVVVLGYSVHTALTIAAALAQVGEFSFILAQQALGYGLIDEKVYLVFVVCALVSITLNPSVFKHMPKIEGLLKKSPKLWHLLNARAEKRAAKSNPVQTADIDFTCMTCAIVVGYGPTGRSVVEALEKKNIEAIIIDLNVDTVNELVQNGKHAIYGDSTKRDILSDAGIEQAAYLIITVADNTMTAGTVAAARTFNTDLKVLARVRFQQDEELIKTIGADYVAGEESSVAKTLANVVMENLGETPEPEEGLPSQ